MVRDAISQCFFDAHCVYAGIDEKDSETNKIYCKEIVKKMFSDCGGDFEHPTKESIMGTVKGLVEFSKNFRDPMIIQKHRDEIMKLIEKLK